QLQDTGLAEFELEDTPVQMPVMFPPDAREGESASVQVVTMSADAIASTPIALTDAETAHAHVNILDIQHSIGGRMPDLADTQPMPAVPDLASSYYLDDDLHPHTMDGEAIPHLIDEDKNSHWFTIVERDARFTDEPDLTHELRYFRARHTPEGEVQEVSYPVMPLPDDDPKHAWMLPDLERQLAGDDLYNAQQLAHDTAMFYGQDFPDPLDLTYFEGDPDYYFEYDVSENDLPALYAVKTWMDGTDRRFDTLTIGEYGMFESAEVDDDELVELREKEGLQAAMNLAETLAVEGGYLDGNRDDPRMFFKENAPSDPFVTDRERELAEKAWELETEEFETVDELDWDVETTEFEVLDENIVENPYWHLDTLPVNTPDGEPLGHALHIVVYDTVAQPTDTVGSPEIPEDASLRMMELAHFETPDAAEDFSTAFVGYVKPDVLEGPELAVEVARLEGLPASWKTLDYEEREQYRAFDYNLERTPEQWHLHNPQAERDARIEAEGMNQDTIPPIEQA
ncbi:MAG: hypothetical protein AAFQ07_12920, partial [Chloroflexota bacterium]